MIKLSFVIPVYNVEQYIGKCLESCLNQDLLEDEFEIIVVNDATPDNSLETVRRFQSHSRNIRVINRPNGGLSAARNTGLDNVRGEYVWFVDSDDWIAPDCIGSLYDCAKKSDLDVLCFGLNLAYPDGRIAPFYISYEENERIYEGKEFITAVKMPPAAWAALYKTEFLRKHMLKFLEGILHEDQEFTPRAYTLAQRIAFTDRHLYFYNQRQGGIMKSCRNIKRCRDLLTVADSLFDFAERNVERGTATYDTLMRKVYFCVTQSLAFYSKEAFPLSEYKSRPYFPMDASICMGQMRHKLRLANFSLRLYTAVYKWLRG